VTTHKVGYLIGSLAKESINRKLAKALVRLAPPELEMSEISFRDLPLYSYDYDADYPPEGKAFKASIAAVDAVLFVTPEYNRSIPGGLKNAIDWASRPYGTNSFTGKPSAVIGTSPGAIGTAVAQQNLRSVLGFCNSPQMNAPEAYASLGTTERTLAMKVWNSAMYLRRNSAVPAFVTSPSSVMSPFVNWI
jgi:chromate reductase